jgi:hypothetical protein
MTRLWTVVVVLLFGWTVGLAAQEPADELDPLLKLLVEQGVITEQQARGVQAEYDRREGSQAEVETVGEPVQVEPGTEDSEAAPMEPVTAQVSMPSAGAELEGVRDLKIGALAYLSYQDGTLANGTSYGDFLIKRGYIDIRKKITPYFSARITPDVHQDEGGDLKVRLKYAYGQFNFNGSGLLQKPYVEVGVSHMPWLDFEEHINRFRMQGTMLLQRNGLLNSAGVGILVGGNLGDEMPEDYREHVNDHYAGRWVSFGLGVYNGGGYHANSNNSKVVVEGRLTVRPLPSVVPGLQGFRAGPSWKRQLRGFARPGCSDWDAQLREPVPSWQRDSTTRARGTRRRLR